MDFANMNKIGGPCIRGIIPQIFFLLFISVCCSADVLRTEDGRIIEGVVLEENPENIVFSSLTGNESFPSQDIKNIEYDTVENNLLFLADTERGKNNIVKAYYLYEKVLLTDPDAPRAVKALESLEPYLRGKDGREQWTAFRERYQNDKVRGKDDKQVLSGNSDDTEKLEDIFGIMLSIETGRIKVQYVKASSRAENGGVMSNDYLLKVGGRPVNYMGLFDVVSLLLERAAQEIPITVEREIRFWVSEENIRVSSVMEFAGFSLAENAGRFVMSGVKEGSFAFQGGLRPADVLLSINNDPVVNFSSPKDITKAIKGMGSHYITVVIKRLLVV